MAFCLFFILFFFLHYSKKLKYFFLHFEDAIQQPTSKMSLNAQLTEAIHSQIRGEDSPSIFPMPDLWYEDDHKEFIRLLKMRYLIQGWACDKEDCYFYINEEWDHEFFKEENKIPKMKFIPQIEVKNEEDQTEEEDQTVLDMTNDEIIKGFDEWHGEEMLLGEGHPLCFENFDFDGWRKYMYERGNEEPEEAIDASYENHAEFHEEDGVWRINWEGEAPCDDDSEDEDSEDDE